MAIKKILVFILEIVVILLFVIAKQNYLSDTTTKKYKVYNCLSFKNTNPWYFVYLNKK